MAYSYMSNIDDFSYVTYPSRSYQVVGTYKSNTTETPTNGVITFVDENNIAQKANFIMIRAHYNNDLLIQLYPSNYGVYIPAGELWAVDSIDKIEKIIIRKMFNNEGQSFTTGGRIQWMIGYK